MMKRYPVRGNNHIDRIGHDSNTGTVEIRFNDDSPGVFQYWDVPAEVFEGLYNASDPWSYFQDNIYKKFEKRQVDDVVAEEGE